MIYLGEDPIGFNTSDMKLINKHTVSQAYTTTLEPLYNNEIKPYITFGNYHKICVVTFKNNTSTASGRINMLFFSLVQEPAIFTDSQTNGGMIRNDFTNLRNLLTTNDAKCSADTEVCIYEIDIE